MYVVRVNDDRVEVSGKTDADKLITMLNMLDCPGQISKQELKGHKDQAALYSVECLDDIINVIGLENAIKTVYWLMYLEMPEANIKRKENKNDNLSSSN